ncbi:MAG: AAA family ATPase [Muribaculaceae bacterium]|nr:AAA family ATPase [Muribaculaceae bacterium]
MSRKIINRNASHFIIEQRRLLTIEYEQEKKSFSEAVDKVGVERLVERGVAKFPVAWSRNFYNSLNQRILEVAFSSEEEDDDDRHFEYGRPVSFFRLRDDGKINIIFNGTISYVRDGHIGVIVSETSMMDNTSSNGELGIMLSFDETSYKMMFDTLTRLENARGRLGELRDLIYSRRVPEEYKVPDITLSYLNRSQQLAVNNVLRAKDVAIVHGPPGTGKTTALVEAIYETLRKESQVLVCAQSNSAVDLICERLAERGINVLRIGNPSRVTDRMLASTYERRFESHPDYADLWSIRKAIREIRSSRRRTDSIHQKLDRLKARATELEFRINNDIFREARVIAATLVGSGHKVLAGMKFSSLFIDEAAQALEAASWIPIDKAGRVILAGDHYQLPPTVKSYEAFRQGLSVSLMERIADFHPESVSLLTVQYRMRSEIMEFPNRWFYQGKMEAAREVADRSILDLDSAVEWVDTSRMASAISDSSYSEKENESGEAETYAEKLWGPNGGRVNVDEALLTISVLLDYLKKIGIKRVLEEKIDISVISPYKAQVGYLRKLIKHSPDFKLIRKLITVNTVDGFQGRESDIVVISLVRSNEKGDIGFLRDYRRMNVAITRARMKLIIIGNMQTLGHHKFFRMMHAYIDHSRNREESNDAPYAHHGENAE